MTGAPYGYVDNNPLNGTDPLGLFCFVHDSHGGCKGAGVLRAAQKPIRVIGAVSAGVAAGAQVLAAACAATIIGAIPCTLPLEGVAINASVVAAGAAAETTLYTCSTDGFHKACYAGIASTAISTTGIGLSLLKLATPAQKAAVAVAGVIKTAAVYGSSKSSPSVATCEPYLGVY